MQVQMLAPRAAGSTPRALPGPISVLMSVIRTNGVRGLWLGQTGTLIRETGGTAAWFSTKEYVASLLVARRLRNEHGSDASLATASATELQPWESALSGAIAGASFNLALFPADTVKSTMQTAEELRPTAMGAAAQPKATFGGTFMALYRAQGIRGLYAGCGITVARSIPSSAMIFLIYDGLKNYFG
jgi:ornithine carrier protein